MLNILVVEDSPIVRKIINHVMLQYSNFKPTFTASLSETKSVLEERADDFFAALVDLSLPDAPDGEVVDLVLSFQLPSVVLTGSFNPDKRTQLLAKGVVDYVTKEGKFSYRYALDVINRLNKNRAFKVMVVDDSAMSRNVVVNMLRLHLFEVYDAEDGLEAVRTFVDHPEIKMIITDYNMPGMDGCELVKSLRQKYDKSDLILIGISSEDGGELSAQFIKNGANDFLRKPFHHEEFFCRINHNVELMELVESMKDSSMRDDQTGAYKLSYFRKKGEALFEKAFQDGSPLACGVIDLDDLSEIFSQYGPEAGDLVMTQASQLLIKAFSRFLFARAGGETFYILLPGLDNLKAVAFVEKVRELLGNTFIDIGTKEVSLSYSAGVSNALGNNLAELLDNATLALQRARDAGGDLVVGDG